MRGQDEAPEEGQQNRANAGEKLEKGRHHVGQGLTCLSATHSIDALV